jgi:hypothetical protein
MTPPSRSRFLTMNTGDGAGGMNDEFGAVTPSR